MKNIDHNAAVRLIGTSLRGPVAEVFRKLVPALAGLEGDAFYDTVMGSADLLHACFIVFQKRRDAFAHLLVDAQNRPVNDDMVRLRCGRTLREILAMVVRTHAKNHFRATLGGDPNNPSTPAGKVYQALNEYLIHEWQIPLVDHYTKIPAEKLRHIGPAILDARDAPALQLLSGTPAPPPRPAPQAIEAPITDLKMMGLTSASLRNAHQWWDALHDPTLRGIVMIPNEREMREMTSAFAEIGEITREKLLSAVPLSPAQGAVVLATAYRLMGRAGFSGIFGTPGNATAIAMLARKLGQENRNDLPALARAVESTIRARARKPRPATSA